MAIERAAVICLAPQNSRTSVGLYRAALNVEGGTPFAVDFVDSWHDHPLLIKAFAEKFRAGGSGLATRCRAKVPVIFTAHSVPQRTIAEGDPYEAQTKETAMLVAREAGLAARRLEHLPSRARVCRAAPGLDPRSKARFWNLKEGGHRGVFVQPIGFLCDHVEVLYDIDIGFKEFAEKEGMRLWRAIAERFAVVDRGFGRFGAIANWIADCNMRYERRRTTASVIIFGGIKEPT